MKMTFASEMLDTPEGAYKPWILAPEVFLTEAPDGYAGFVYLIHNAEHDLNYYGRKAFWKKRKRPPLKGKKRSRIDYVETDWLTYWGSCPELLNDLERIPRPEWDRLVVRMCQTKSEMEYYETKAIFHDDAMLRPNFYNGGCRAVFHGNKLKGVPNPFI